MEISKDQILELKNELRLSPKEFANRYGASRRQFYYWISGESNPSEAAKILMKLDFEKVKTAKETGSEFLLIRRN